MKTKFLKRGLVIIIILLIVATVFFVINIFSTKPQSNLDYNTTKCIGNNSILIALKGCKHCHTQIEILGDNKDNFNIIYCEENNQFCVDNQIVSVPTWIINDEKIVGIQTLDKLKALTNC